MQNRNSKSADAKIAAAALLKETRKQERTVEAQTGKELEKGAQRVEERSKSADGKSAGAKQRANRAM